VHREPSPSDNERHAGAMERPLPETVYGASTSPPAGDAVTDLSSRRQHPSLIVINAVRQLRGLVIPIAVLIISGGSRDELWGPALGLVVALFSLVSQALVWWQYRYEVTGGELQVRSGILARRERLIPLERIQSIDVNETPLQRLFRVVGIRVETAAGGGGDTDVKLDALSNAEANLLRQRLAAQQSTMATTHPEETSQPTSPGAAVVAPDEGTLLRRLSTRELLIAGATSGRVGPALALVGFGTQFADDLIPERYWARFFTSNPGAVGFSVTNIVAIIIVIAIFAWLMAIGSMVLTFAQCEVRRQGDRLYVSHGLLDRRRRSIPLRRIQAITISEGLLRQPFGLATINFESAGYGKDTPESGTLFPLIHTSEIPAFLAAVSPDFTAPLDPSMLAPLPPRSRGRYIMAGVWSLLVMTVIAVPVAAWISWSPWWWGLAPLVFVPFAAIAGWWNFQNTGWLIDDQERWLARTGDFNRVTSIVPRRRLQHWSVHQDPLQRRATLATFGAAVASGGGGGTFHLKHLDATTANALLDRLGQRPAATPVGTETVAAPA